MPVNTQPVPVDTTELVTQTYVFGNEKITQTFDCLKPLSTSFNSYILPIPLKQVY